MNYYNEFDPKAAAWLRELINQKHIPEGIVDERSITEILPHELNEFTQCHFFAGIGGWSLALQLAGWPADRPVWTGSCPCQPFSSAGKQLAQADERHLWPAFFDLIRECRPHVVFGEQVASAINKGWLDGISSDLESEGYACGAVVCGAHSVGAPHIRQRLYWVADSDANGRHQGLQSIPGGPPERIGSDSQLIWVGKPNRSGRESRESSSSAARYGHTAKSTSDPCWVGNADDARPQEHREPRDLHLWESDRPDSRRQHINTSLDDGEPRTASETNGFWRNADWLRCRDDKWRRVESGTFPLADGVPGRVGLLRGYGNAIVPQTAQAFIEAFLD